MVWEEPDTRRGTSREHGREVRILERARPRRLIAVSVIISVPAAPCDRIAVVSERKLGRREPVALGAHGWSLVESAREMQPGARKGGRERLHRAVHRDVKHVATGAPARSGTGG